MGSLGALSGYASSLSVIVHMHFIHLYLRIKNSTYKVWAAADKGAMRGRIPFPFFTPGPHPRNFPSPFDLPSPPTYSAASSGQGCRTNSLFLLYPAPAKERKRRGHSVDPITVGCVIEQGKKGGGSRGGTGIAEL